MYEERQPTGLLAKLTLNLVLVLAILLMDIGLVSATGFRLGSRGSTERNVCIKAKFFGPVAKISCEKGFPGPRMRWGISSHIRLPKLSVIRDIRLRHRKEKRLGMRNDKACYLRKGHYAIEARIPRSKSPSRPSRELPPTGKERLLFTADAVYEIDDDGWITFAAPVCPVDNGLYSVELSIVEPRLVSRWQVPEGLQVKELKKGEYRVKGRLKRVSRDSARGTIRWKVKNFSEFSSNREGAKLVGDLVVPVSFSSPGSRSKESCFASMYSSEAKLNQLHWVRFITPCQAWGLLLTRKICMFLLIEFMIFRLLIWVAKSSRTWDFIGSILIFFASSRDIRSFQLCRMRDWR